MSGPAWVTLLLGMALSLLMMSALGGDNDDDDDDFYV